MTGRGAALAAVAAETLAVVIVAARPALWLLALLAHVAAAALVARAWPRARPDRRLFAFALTLALPALGLAGLGGLAALRRLAESGREEIAGGGLILPEPDAVDGDEPIVEWVQRRLAVRPLTDILRHGDGMSQRWAVRALAQRDDPAAVELLRDALQVASRDVQIAAASGLRRIDDRMSRRVTRALATTSQAPEQAEGWQALAEAWCAYAESGLLPRPLARRALEGAAGAYSRALRCDPADRTSKDALGRILIALNRHGEAEPLLRDSLLEAPTAAAETALATLLFEQGRWTELRDLTRAAVAAGRADARLTWWAAA
jgi:tetratricopeptide (TPR) repeat protein